RVAPPLCPSLAPRPPVSPARGSGSVVFAHVSPTSAPRLPPEYAPSRRPGLIAAAAPPAPAAARRRRPDAPSRRGRRATPDRAAGGSRGPPGNLRVPRSLRPACPATPSRGPPCRRIAPYPPTSRLGAPAPQGVDLRRMQAPTAVPRLELRARDDPGGERREGAPGRGPRALDLAPQRHLAGRSKALDTIDLEQVLCDRVGFSAAQGSGRSRRCPRGHPSNRR